MKKLSEMAQFKAKDIEGGGFSDRQIFKAQVQGLRNREHSYETRDGRVWAVSGVIGQSSLKAGDLVLAKYNETNSGAEPYEIIGVTDNNDSSEPKWQTVKQALEAIGAANMQAASDVLAKDLYLIAKDLNDGDIGPWFYPFHGAWARGSGAEKLTFYRIEQVTDYAERQRMARTPAPRRYSRWESNGRTSLGDRLDKDSTSKPGPWRLAPNQEYRIVAEQAQALLEALLND